MLRHDIAEILLKLALNTNQSVTRKNSAKALFLVYIQKPVWLGQKKKMCVYGHPTYPTFCWRPYAFLHRIRITIFVV
jgi:hypothetical protein